MRSLLLATFLMCSTFCWGFENFEKGYVVLQEGDTLFGLIDNQYWEDNPEKVRFKISNDAPVSEYTSADIRYFFVERSLELFRGASVSLRITEKAYTDDPVSYVRQFDGFLETLVLGKINLYKITINKIENFFIEGEGGPLVQLEMQVVVKPMPDGTNKKTIVHLYRGVLQSRTGDVPTLQADPAGVRYGEGSFTSFVRKYNEQFSSNTYEKKEAKKLYKSAGVLAGAMISSLLIEKSGDVYKYDAFEVTAFSPSLGGYLIFYSEKGQGRWGFYNELVYKSANKDLTYEFNQGVFSYNSEIAVRIKRLRYSPCVRISKVTSKDGAWFVQAGMYMSIALTSDEITRHSVRNSTQFPAEGTSSYNTSYRGFTGGVGYRYKDLEVEARADINTGTHNDGERKAFGVVAKWRLTKR